MKSEPSESKLPENSPKAAPDTDEIVINSIKTENIDISDNEEDEEKNSDIADSEINQSYQISTENAVPRSSLISGTAATGSITLNASPEIDNKYCHVCDIKFKYMSSYIAHKKSYCRNIQSDLDIGAVTSNQATSVIATTRSSPSQTSVVT